MASLCANGEFNSPDFVGELEADGRGEFGEGEAQVVLAGAAHLPASAAAFVGKGVGVFDGERGLAQSADAVDGSDDADVAGLDEVLAQHPQIDGAANEVRIVRVHVTEVFFGSFAARDGLNNLADEFAHAFLQGGFAQGCRGVGKKDGCPFGESDNFVEFDFKRFAQVNRLEDLSLHPLDEFNLLLHPSGVLGVWTVAKDEHSRALISSRMSSGRRASSSSMHLRKNNRGLCPRRSSSLRIWRTFSKSRCEWDTKIHAPEFSSVGVRGIIECPRCVCRHELLEVFRMPRPKAVWAQRIVIGVALDAAKVDMPVNVACETTLLADGFPRALESRSAC